MMSGIDCTLLSISTAMISWSLTYTFCKKERVKLIGRNSALIDRALQIGVEEREQLKKEIRKRDIIIKDVNTLCIKILELVEKNKRWEPYFLSKIQSIYQTIVTLKLQRTQL